MTRPEDVAFRVRAATFAVLRIALAFALLVGLLVAPALALGPGWGVPLGMLLAAIAAVATATGRTLPLYPADAFGVEHRVDEDTFDGPRKHCTECGKRTTQGLRRRYARQFVVLGVPLYTLEWGVNDYCLDCARPGGGPGVDPRSANGRVFESDESAARELDRALDR
ncbi:hypothetical protein [Salinilacihabitans rarus]|uniref:hypothetical protein n=1 Tax=Salinilacihabitans rarus TaxID=2961596 RepID=UPI0020C901F8|nr:hypothetical protein [Salinilacihabitans rarus]